MCYGQECFITGQLISVQQRQWHDRIVVSKYGFKPMPVFFFIIAVHIEHLAAQTDHHFFLQVVGVIELDKLAEANDCIGNAAQGYQLVYIWKSSYQHLVTYADKRR